MSECQYVTVNLLHNKTTTDWCLQAQSTTAAVEEVITANILQPVLLRVIGQLYVKLDRHCIPLDVGWLKLWTCCSNAFTCSTWIVRGRYVPPLASWKISVGCQKLWETSQLLAPLRDHCVNQILSTWTQLQSDSRQPYLFTTQSHYVTVFTSRPEISHTKDNNTSSHSAILIRSLCLSFIKSNICDLG